MPNLACPNRFSSGNARCYDDIMKKPDGIHLPLNGSALGTLLTRQRDEFSCGPACMTSAATLYGVTNMDYDKFRAALSPNPQTGSDNFDMATLAEKTLPFVSSGEDCYAGGIAIANIMQEEGHYVVFLCREGERVIYYDPYHHELVENDIDAVEWVSESGHLTKWCINLAPLEGNSIDKWRRLAQTPAADNRPEQPAPRAPR